MANPKLNFPPGRRLAREVVIGNPAQGGVIIGGQHPIMVQSMITCDTMDTAACVEQTLELAKVGCQLVRITAPTVKDAANLKNIVAELHARGCLVPIAADIHFKPEAAMEAALWVEKIRVNPGNYADTKKFAIKEYTDADYAAELERIEEKFTPLVKLCQQLGRAMRIGTNHGSLSDRILNRFGDTPEGMVESALEFARIARKHNYHNFLFSMKASNVKVMIESYRLLVAQLEALGPDWNYPIHLGVTEAGDGEDGRVKSAIGIGSLLADGLGDTIRVSLTEDSPYEIPVCHRLIAQIPWVAPQMAAGKASANATPISFDPFHYERFATEQTSLPNGCLCGGTQTVRVITSREIWNDVTPRLRSTDNVRPEAAYEDCQCLEIDPATEFPKPAPGKLVTVADTTPMPAIAAYRLLAVRLKALGAKNPILLKDHLAKPQESVDADTALLRSSVVLGSLLADGIGDAILIRNENRPQPSIRLAYTILQAVGCRSFKTDYVACPSCGRTLFNLQTTTALIKARTQHLKGVKIAIMGCIVNGPGEMADADFGYVGGAPGKVNLYVGKTAVKFNIPQVDAVDRLVDLIREHGKWVEPVETPALAER